MNPKSFRKWGGCNFKYPKSIWHKKAQFNLVTFILMLIRILNYTTLRGLSKIQLCNLWALPRLINWNFCYIPKFNKWGCVVKLEFNSYVYILFFVLVWTQQILLFLYNLFKNVYKRLAHCDIRKKTTATATINQYIRKGFPKGIWETFSWLNEFINMNTDF